MGIREIAVSRGQTVHNFRRSHLHIKEGFNIRDMSAPDNIAHVEDLARQIEERGFEGNIDIFMDGDRPTIWRGHCRMAAVDLLIEAGKWDDTTNLVPALVKPQGVGLLEMYAEQSRNGDSKALSPREGAANLLRIMNMVGQDVGKTAKLVGKSPSWVSQQLAFNEVASPDVHEAIAAGEISQSQAATILRHEGAAKGAETIKEAVRAAKASGKKKVTRKDIVSSDPSRDAVKTAALVLARDFLDRTIRNQTTAGRTEAKRVIGEIDLALGRDIGLVAAQREMGTA